MRSRVLVVGYLSIDTIVTPDGRWDDIPGGAALYAALGARRVGAQVTLASAVGEDFPPRWLLQLADLGINVSQVQHRPGPTRKARLVHDKSGRRSDSSRPDETWLERTAALLPSLPIVWHGFEAVVAAPIPPVLLSRLVRVAPCPVVADTSEAFAGTDPDAVLAALPKLHSFAPSLAETRLLRPGLPDDDAAEALAALGPRVMQKRGGEGALAVAAGVITPLSAPAARVVDPTGAGDATVGALTALLAAGQDFVAAASTSLETGAVCVSAPGPSGLGFEIHPPLRRLA